MRMRTHATCQRCMRLRPLGDLVPFDDGYVCAHSWCDVPSPAMRRAAAAQRATTD